MHDQKIARGEGVAVDCPPRYMRRHEAADCFRIAAQNVISRET